MSNRLFIDANIPMYVNGSDHPLKAPCVAILAALADGRLQGATSAEVIQEIVYRYVQIGRRRLAREVASQFLAVVPDLLPVTMQDVHLLLSSVDQFPRLPARDLLHVAVMINNGISEIVSTDSHFDSVPLVKRIDPRSFQPQP